MLWMFLKEEGLAKKKRNIDWAGATLFTFGITALLFALLTGGVKYAWTSPLILGLLAAGIVLLALFLWLETRVPEPMLPLGLFRIPAITVSNLAGFLSSALLIGLNVYLPLWVQGVSGKGATGAGLVLLPMSIGWPLGATLGGRLMLRTGPRRTAFVGLLLILSGTVWLANVEPGWSHWHLYAIMLVTGFGFGFVTTVMTVIVQSSVGWNLRGVATASNTLLRTLGQTLGVAVFGMLFNHWIAAELATRPEKSGISPARFNALLNPHGMKTLEGKELAAMRDVLAYGIHHLFMALVVLALATLAVTLLFPARRPEMHDAPGNLKRA
jgi:MFS family permease